MLADDYGWLSVLAVWLLLFAAGFCLIEIVAVLYGRRKGV
jgi:hypothetical protein